MFPSFPRSQHDHFRPALRPLDLRGGALKGGVSIRQTERRNVPFLLVLHLWFCMSFQKRN